MNEQESHSYISGLAQTAPFRFVDRVVWKTERKIITELNKGGMPNRFAEADCVDTYVMLEYVAQSSGLLLRERKGKERGVIASFKKVERLEFKEIAFPIRLESVLVEERAPMYTFDFTVFSEEQCVLRGTTSIFIGG